MTTKVSEKSMAENPGGGAKPPKFPTKLPNFRQPPPFALKKTVFSPVLGQNFRNFL